MVRLVMFVNKRMECLKYVTNYACIMFTKDIEVLITQVIKKTYLPS